MPTITLKQGEPLRIGAYLYVSPTALSETEREEDEERRYPQGSGSLSPGNWPDMPPKPRNPTQKEYEEWLAAFLAWSVGFYAEVWSYFTVLGRFTLDGATVADRVRLSGALNHLVEIHPDTGNQHASAQMSQDGLSAALAAGIRNQKEVSWNDLHDIRVRRNEKRFPPGPKGDSLRDTVDRIPNQTLDVDFRIEGTITVPVE